MGTGAITLRRALLVLCLGANWTGAFLSWQLLVHGTPPLLSSLLACFSLLLVFLLLWLRLVLVKTVWVQCWVWAAPWFFSAVFVLPGSSLVPFLPLVCGVWVLFGLWGAVRFFPLTGWNPHLHTAHFAKLDDLSSLLQSSLASDGLLLGTRLPSHCVVVRPTPTRRELGNLLIVGPTRSGKGLLATSQLLSWHQSVVVNDIKGELFTATAGYRQTLGPVFVLDPTGVGHRYDPLLGKQSEDALFSAASHLLFKADEGEGAIFTQRAIVMLTQVFLAARAEGMPPLPYVRQIIRAGLPAAAARLQRVSPDLATQFLDVTFPEANLADRFLVSAWGTLSARLRPLLTETVVRCFAGADFAAAALLCSPRPVSVYLRWPERDLLALSPLVRLLWGSLIDELVTTYDHTQGAGCRPVLLVIDEAGRTAIPSLADHATTVVGRGVSLWMAIQSLSQLEAVYGKARAQVLRDNMDSQVYYRPTDLATAQYLEHRLGKRSAYARSHTVREGTASSEGRSEQAIPLLTAQDILQLRDEEILGFHRRLPPFRLTRMDWRKHPILAQRRTLAAPHLAALPQLADLPSGGGQSHAEHVPQGYIDPDRERA